ERPAEDPRLGLVVAGRGDHALEVGDGRGGIERRVVDVHAHLLLDDAEKIDASERIQSDVGTELRGRPYALRGHVRGARDEALHVGELALRRGRGPWWRFALAHREDALDDLRLLDLLRRRCRERVLWPDRPATDLLRAGQLRVGRAHDVGDDVRILWLHEH